MIGRLLERGQHEYAVLHFGHAETRNTQHFALRGGSARTTDIVNNVAYLVCHNISEKHHMARVYAHTMCGHGVLNLINDGSSCSFNAQNLRHLHYVVRRCVFAHNA